MTTPVQDSTAASDPTFGAGSDPAALSIAAVERDTGLSKDTLRVWERRYGFPAPARDGAGERAYPPAQVEKLRVLKRLLDAGHRPGQIVALALPALQALTEESVGAQPRGGAQTMAPAVIGGLLDRVRQHDARGLRSELTGLLARIGVASFMVDAVGPLNAAVGDAWLRGEFGVFQEHMFSEVMQATLRQAIAAIPESDAANRPRVLLTTFAGEPHVNGLLMAEAMLALEGCVCVSLGGQTPAWDVVLAAAAYRADIVALSFTGCLNPNQVVAGLTELRQKLPEPTAVWVGGSAPVLERRPVTGVRHFPNFEPLAAELRNWRAAHTAAAGAAPPPRNDGPTSRP